MFQTIGNQDAEQNLFNQIAAGIDHGDLLSVRAPKPALIITTTRDFFSIQGARETEEEVSLIYKVYGMEGNFGRAEDDDSHASTSKNREAMYAFFRKHLKNPGNSIDEPVKCLSAGEMQVTPTGQVSTSLGGETVYSLNLKETEKLAARMQFLRRDPEKFLPEALLSAKKLSGYHEPSENDEPVFSGRYLMDGYIVEKYFIKGEGNYVIPYLLFTPSVPCLKALIYINPAGKAAEASRGGEIEWFVRHGFTVLAADLIGSGETGPGDFKGDAYIDGGSHNIWYASMLIGRSIVGIRAGDVVKLVRLLKKDNNIREISAVARGEMAPVILHAAAFDQSLARIALIEPFSSYLSIVRNRFYNSSFIHGVVPGALKSYDLPDLAATLAPRCLVMAGVTDGAGKTSDTGEISNDIAIIKDAYNAINAEENLRILAMPQNNHLEVIFTDWLK